jgi:8-oxo-dGTP pyrophosphatase MutT (NUDIX family)
MEQYVVHPVDPDVEIHITREMPPIPPALEARISAIWATAAARVEAGGAGRLFNGLVFSIDTIAPDRITGHLTEFRRLVAQVEDHTLFPELGLRSLAACGVMRCSGGVLIGRRPPAAIYQPGMWQLCPAGSVDAGARRENGTMDYRGQLLTELREELGLPPDVIGEVTPLCVVEHPGSHVCDFGMAVHTSLDPDDIMEAHRTRGNGEYDPLRIVPVSHLSDFIVWAGAKLVPPTPLFLAQAGLLPSGFSPPTELGIRS